MNLCLITGNENTDNEIEHNKQEKYYNELIEMSKY